MRDSIEENERIHLLLHEIGHIYKHHVDNNPTEKSDYYEYEANKFADNVKYYVNQNRLKRKALCVVPTFLMSTLIVVVVALNFKGDKSDVFYYQEPAVTTNEQTTELITKENIESVTEHKEEDSEKMYYVSKSGKKYHLEDCNYINADECTKLTLDEAKNLGYEPCKVCKPDKYN